MLNQTKQKPQKNISCKIQLETFVILIYSTVLAVAKNDQIKKEPKNQWSNFLVQNLQTALDKTENRHNVIKTEKVDFQLRISEPQIS